MFIWVDDGDNRVFQTSELSALVHGVVYQKTVNYGNNRLCCDVETEFKVPVTSSSGYKLFVSVLQKMLTFYPESELRCFFLMQHFQRLCPNSSHILYLLNSSPLSISSFSLLSVPGRNNALVTCRRTLTVKARLWSQASPRLVCGGQSETGKDLGPPPPPTSRYHSTRPPCE
jgi:hypothetical protein